MTGIHMPAKHSTIFKVNAAEHYLPSIQLSLGVPPNAGDDRRAMAELITGKLVSTPRMNPDRLNGNRLVFRFGEVIRYAVRQPKFAGMAGFSRLRRCCIMWT
jgi:hypothetical protein